MSKIIFMTNVIRRFGIMQQMLDKLQNNGEMQGDFSGPQQEGGLAVLTVRAMWLTAMLMRFIASHPEKDWSRTWKRSF